jgi:hypothetical protein
MARKIVLILLLCSAALAQTTKPAAKPKLAAVCTESKDSADLKSMLTADLERERARTAELEKKLADAEFSKNALLSVNKEQAQEIAKLQALAVNADKLNSRVSELTDQYNQLLYNANAIINTQNQRLARQQRIANALAVYSAMPKYTYTPLPPPQAPPRHPSTV